MDRKILSSINRLKFDILSNRSCCHQNLFLLIVLCVIGCKPNISESGGLRKLTTQELLHRARLGDWPDQNMVKYVLENGDTIGFEEMANLPYDSIAFDDYVDSTGKVVMAKIRPITARDQTIRDSMIIVFNEGPEPNSIKIDCTNLGNLLDSANWIKAIGLIEKVIHSNRI